MKSIVNSQWSIINRITFHGFLLSLALFLLQPVKIKAAEVDLKPGDTIGPQNWKRVEEMVGPNLLSRIKGGYTFQIKAPKRYTPPKEYVEATEKHSAKVGLGSKGELLNYVAGLPFPKIDPNDPEVAQKLIWNFYWRWQGDDQKQGGGFGPGGKVITYTLEKGGFERRVDRTIYYIFPRSRLTLDPKPVIPGYEHIDRMTLRLDEYPRDTSATTMLEIRYADPDRPDDLYLYIPSIRRIRRATTTLRCQTLAPTEYNLDDIFGFNARVTDFHYKFLGEKKNLTNFAQEKLPYARKAGDYLPLDEKWEVRDAYVVEITPKDPNYCVSKRILWIDKTTWTVTWAFLWDRKGDYWKENLTFFIPTKLPDGQEIWGGGTAVVSNVQNGRSTVVSYPQAYNNNYPPSLFSLATLQRMMRGGSVE